MRLRLREHRRGISWRETVALTIAAIATLYAIEVLLDEPASSVLSVIVFVLMGVAGRLMVNRDPIQ